MKKTLKELLDRYTEEDIEGIIEILKYIDIALEDLEKEYFDTEYELKYCNTQSLLRCITLFIMLRNNTSISFI